jgi:hypothetical protein
MAKATTELDVRVTRCTYWFVQAFVRKLLQVTNGS